MVAALRRLVCANIFVYQSFFICKIYVFLFVSGFEQINLFYLKLNTWLCEKKDDQMSLCHTIYLLFPFTYPLLIKVWSSMKTEKMVLYLFCSIPTV